MRKTKKILVLDVGGAHVKMRLGHARSIRMFASGAALTAKKMVTQVQAASSDWHYDAVSIGYPGVVLHGKPVAEPHNLGGGWVGFAFQKAFGKPVRVINDAAMQAMGSYKGGRMLFLGLGTGWAPRSLSTGLSNPPSLRTYPISAAEALRSTSVSADENVWDQRNGARRLPTSSSACTPRSKWITSWSAAAMRAGCNGCRKTHIAVPTATHSSAGCGSGSRAAANETALPLSARSPTRPSRSESTRQAKPPVRARRCAAKLHRQRSCRPRGPQP